MMDIRKIMDMIPHRYPILLVDRVISMEEGKSIEAIKCVSINEPFFLGHFPGLPIMPGVLIVEAMAQAGGLLALASEKEEEIHNKLFLFRGIEKAKFRKTVVPGDVLYLHAQVIKRRKGFMTFECKALVDGEIAAEAEVSALMLDKSEGEGII
jgi:3-hydroxyacyl-[acyl-carrier-protein] dehydratase